MSGPCPVALGYVAARTKAEADRQRHEIASTVAAEGLALADVLDDARDGITISQVTEAARRHGANIVVVPSDARLAEAYTRLAYELEQQGVCCTLLGDPHPAARQGRALAGLGSRS